MESAYVNDDRVKAARDGTWMVSDPDNDWAEYSVANVGAGWMAFDARGNAVMSRIGDFDAVVHALIGDPR